MVARNYKRTGKPRRKSPARRHGVRERIRRRQLVPAELGDCAKPLAISPDHPNETDDLGRLMKALGTADPDFVKGLSGQLLQASGGRGRFDGKRLFFDFAVIKGAKPEDQLVAMLLAQMAAVHDVLMNVAGQVNRADNVPNQDNAIRAVTQLARTYIDQLKGLKRYRSGGEQRGTVQNVSVSRGANAIVGNVIQATPGSVSEERETLALTDARQPPMKILGEPQQVLVTLRRTPKT
jgi:hypothetical protein